jgi:hypothetical protein
LVLGSVAQPPSRIRFTTKPAPPAYRFGVDAKFTTNMSIPRRVAIMVRNAIRPVSVNNSRGQRWVVSNRIRHTTLSRHVLSELTTLGLPRLQAMLSEAVAFGEISFSGMLPSEGTPAAEIKALIAELRGVGLPTIRKEVKSETREGVKA